MEESERATEICLFWFSFTSACVSVRKQTSESGISSIIYF